MRQSAESELSTQKTLQGKVASNIIHLFQTSHVHSLRGRHKKGRGRGEGEKRQREKGRARRLLPLSPIPLPFSLPPYPLPLSTPATQVTTYTESGTFADSGRVEQILSKAGSSYKRPTPGPPHRAKENVKQHLIRDKFLLNPIKQKK